MLSSFYCSAESTPIGEISANWAPLFYPPFLDADGVRCATWSASPAIFVSAESSSDGGQYRPPRSLANLLSVNPEDER